MKTATQAEEKNITRKSTYIMTEESILSFLCAEEERGVSKERLSQRKHFALELYKWLPAEKVITKENLRAWRQALQDKGYSSMTIQNYVKGINQYLNHVGCSDLKFSQGRAKDLTGQQFGFLTALEATGEKHRRDLVWRCRCKCGNEIDLPATRLLTGNTLSCGCLHVEHLQRANKYIDGTSIRQALEDPIKSTRNKSGFIGVTERNGKWRAQIYYKGQYFYLGSYSKLEDAVKARARAKELVQEDAQALLEIYNELHEQIQPLPTKDDIVKQASPIKNTEKQTSAEPALRSDNTSGCAGVTRHRNRWVAKITYQKKTYQLGSFSDQESAVRARKTAEQELQRDPACFIANHSLPEKLS